MLELFPNNDWKDRLSSQFALPYWQQLTTAVNHKYEEGVVFPPRNGIFQAFKLTPFETVKAVIIGQDPYHGAGQAHGLCFSVQKGVKLPPSLKNIFKELESDVGCKPPVHGYLESWAKQGVLLLNSVLTVNEGLPASHQKLGWEKLTDYVICALNEREKPVVFILWGKHAEEKAKLIDNQKHGVIISVHPSPLSARRGFFGSKPFSGCNNLLRQYGVEPIDWSLSE